MNFKCLTSIVKWGGTSHRFSASKVQEKNKKFYHRTEQQWRVLGILAYDLSYIAMCLNFELIQSCAQWGRSKENLVLYLSYPARVSFLMFKVLILQEICQEIQASMPRMECGFILFFFFNIYPLCNSQLALSFFSGGNRCSAFYVWSGLFSLFPH